MRALIIALLIFEILCLIIFANSVYINSSTEELAELAASIEFNEEGEKQLEKIQSIWNKKSKIFGLSVNFKEIDYLGEVLLSLSSAYKSNDEIEFEKYRLLLLDALDGVSRLERFSVMNIF